MSNNPIDPRMARRYKFQNKSDLLARVAELAASVEETPELRERYRAAFFQLMAVDGAFCPAGNTLLAAGEGRARVSPNCCVLPAVTDANEAQLTSRAVALSRARTGIGIDFSLCSDPVSTLHRLSRALVTLQTEAHDGYLRGNMALLRCDHPRVAEFIACKATPALADALPLFNLSIAIPDRSAAAAFFAGPLLMEAARSAYATGCPGLVFLWRAREQKQPRSVRRALEREFGPIDAVVPCGEQAMHANESCNLGVINIAAESLWNGKIMRFDRLWAYVTLAVRFLDNVASLLAPADPLVAETSRRLRRVGLGVAGWADVLDRIGLPYESPEALSLADSIASAYALAAVRATQALAKERGAAFLSGRRNVTVTCVQPCGNVVQMLGVRGQGIEPDFARDAVHIGPEAHVRMQAVWQRHVENSIAKTVNLAADTTVEDAVRAFRLAYVLGCKSITVYRDGSRIRQPLPLSLEEARMQK